MFKRIKTITVIFILIINHHFMPTAKCQQNNESPELQSRRSEFKKIYEQLQPSKIYGKVVDTKGNPIDGAEVKISWEQATFMIGKPDHGRSILIKSDTNGCWEFVVNKPHRAFVDDVKKPGYDYGSIGNKDDKDDLIYKRTTHDKPVISILRKKGEVTFLLRREEYQLIRVFSPNSQANDLDLLTEKGDASKDGSYVDLHVAADYNKATGKWNVTYSVANETDGIIMSNDIFYEAPSDGYKKKVVLNGLPWPRYLYLRSRPLTIYSRLNLEYSTWKESMSIQGFRISYKAVTNPYGERNLEYETDLDKEWRLADQLKNEATAALLQNKRPQKHDLKKLLKIR